MKYLKKQMLGSSLFSLISLFGAIFFFIVAFKIISNITVFAYATIAYFLSFTFLFMYRKSSSKFDRFDKGDAGEIKVKEVLKSIEDSELIESVTIPNMKGNLDFILLFRGTIYLLEVKNVSSDKTVNTGQIIDRFKDTKNFVKNLLNTEDIPPIETIIVYAGSYQKVNLSGYPKSVHLYELRNLITSNKRRAGDYDWKAIKDEFTKYQEK